jgi:hypothetical protein
MLPTILPSMFLADSMPTKWFEQREKPYTVAKLAINIERGHGLISKHGWGALSVLIQASWFTRTWIVQKAELFPNYPSPPITFACRAHKIAWDRLLHLVTGISVFNLDPYIRVSTEVRASPPFKVLRTIDMIRNSLEIPRLHVVLSRTRDLSSTDTRDKAFGLLGLVEEEIGDVPFLRPEYRKNLVDFYTDLTAYVLSYPGYSVILYLIYNQPDNGKRLPGIPPWVNDWTQKAQQCIFPSEKFNAGPYKGRIISEITISGGPKLLAMKVQSIGLVTCLVYSNRVFREERSEDRKEGRSFIPQGEVFEIDAAGEFVEEASGEERLRRSEFVSEREWYWNYVERAKLLDRRYRTSEMGKNKDLPPKEVSYFGRESLYEAF